MKAEVKPAQENGVQKERMFLIPESIKNAITEYLSTRPIREAGGAFNMLNQLEEHKEGK